MILVAGESRIVSDLLNWGTSIVGRTHARLYDWIVYQRGSKARERKEKNSSAARSSLFIQSSSHVIITICPYGSPYVISQFYIAYSRHTPLPLRRMLKYEVEILHSCYWLSKSIVRVALGSYWLTCRSLAP